MKQRYLVIDVSRCHGCNNCFIACKDEHVDNKWLPYTEEQPRHGHRWLDIHYTERGQYPCIDVCYLPMPCQHCQNAPCMEAYPECVYRREDGVVLIDTEKAKGVKGLVDSCPYGVINWNEEFDIAQKCTMCAHLLDDPDSIQMPRCAHSCPTDAFEFYTIEPDEMQKIIREQELEVYRPELGTKPNVYYKNLYKFTKAFVAGCILENNDCVEGVEVTLKGNGVQFSQNTNGFGDFKFDKLEDGDYSVEACLNGKTVNANAKVDGESVYLGYMEIK